MAGGAVSDVICEQLGDTSFCGVVTLLGEVGGGVTWDCERVWGWERVWDWERAWV